ncbi:MAG TPA: monooxygenase [Angustibacter sp.]|nr:monooxygenase [Angustibacter sp.]
MSEPRTAVLHLWRVPTWRVPSALLRMASTKPALRGTPHLRFTKVLGTGSGRTFTVRDADPHHWALLTVWDDDRAAARFAADESGHRALRSWHGIAAEELVVRLEPIAARGEWSRQQPFGDPAPRKTTGPVASITRARITARKALTFWRAVPPVSHDLHQVDGLRLAVGIGEAPVGLQGTFSVWDDAQALTRFAHRREPHVDAIRRTALEGWYAEELFARFAVLDVRGSYDGHTLDLPTG